MTEGKSAGEKLRELLAIAKEPESGGCARIAEACGIECCSFDNCGECRAVWLRLAADLGVMSERENSRVLDADGVPIEVGDEVWCVGMQPCDEPLKVEDISATVRVNVFHDPMNLTHKRPDSWEALEDDATRDPREYARRRGIERGDVPMETMALDLVARAKRLAGAVE